MKLFFVQVNVENTQGKLKKKKTKQKFASNYVYKCFQRSGKKRKTGKEICQQKSGIYQSICLTYKSESIVSVKGKMPKKCEF